MYLVGFFCFILGAILGSFINVVILRLPDPELSIVGPRSYCFQCKKMIPWYENIPILSYMLLRGRCSSCKCSISIRYLLVEVLVGLLSFALFLKYGLSVDMLQWLIFCCALTSLAFIDLRTSLVPIWLPLFLAVAGICFGLYFSYFSPHNTRSYELESRLLGALGAFFFLGGVVLLSTYVARKLGRIAQGETAMGWGDPLVLASIGSFMGYKALPIIVFLASFQSVIVFLLARILGKQKAALATDGSIGVPEGALPFVPFLVLGAMEVLFFAF